MKCIDPYVKNGQGFPCGRCLPCLFNRRRIWTHRIMLEAAQYTDNAFVTLTYADQHLPVSSAHGLATLIPEHVRNWLKRLRKSQAPNRFRFYLVGEYGDETWRPHYHVALFNYPHCLRGRTRRQVGKGNAPVWKGCCCVCDEIGETWGLGNVDVGMLEISSAQYIAGYVTKKMTLRHDERLLGREPEFARMSNRPGLGASSVWEIADTWLKLDLDKRLTDVPVTLAHGKKELPLGRYLRQKTREAIGREKQTPQVVLDAIAEEVRPLREAAFDASSSFKSALVKAATPSAKKQAARSKIYKKGKSL